VLPLLLLLCACGRLDSPSEVPSPFLGGQEATFLVSCAGDEAAAAAARDAAAGRLHAVRIEPSIAAGAPGSLRVAVKNAERLDDLARLLMAPRDLALVAVAADQSPVQPLHDRVEEAALAPVSDPALGSEGAFAPDAAEAQIAATDGPLPPVAGVRVAARGDARIFAAPRTSDWGPWLQTLALSAGQRAALECWREAGEECCTPVLLEGDALVTLEHIAGSAMKVFHPADPPVLVLVFDPAGAHAFAEASARLVGRKVALVSAGEVVSMPVVREVVSGGRLVVDPGRDPGDQAVFWRVHALVESAALPASCTVER
jgi:hypothetical protein